MLLGKSTEISTFSSLFQLSGAKKEMRAEKQNCRTVIVDDLNFCTKIPLVIYIARSAADPFGWSFYVA